MPRTVERHPPPRLQPRADHSRREWRSLLNLFFNGSIAYKPARANGVADLDGATVFLIAIDRHGFAGGIKNEETGAWNAGYKKV